MPVRGHEEIRVAVVVDIGAGHAVCLYRDSHARLPADIPEIAVPVVFQQVISKFRTVAVTVCNVDIQVPVIVVIEHRGAGKPAHFVTEADFVRKIVQKWVLVLRAG